MDDEGGHPRRRDARGGRPLRRTGRCPRAGADGVVACAGRRIDPVGGPPEYTRLQVLAGTRHCPLNWDLESFGM
jgi:hypothetical protein